MRRLVLLLVMGTALIVPKGPSASAAGDEAFVPELETGEINVGLRDVLRDEYAPGVKARHSDRRAHAPYTGTEIASTSPSTGGSVGWVLVLSSPSIPEALTPPQRTRAPPYLHSA